MKFTLIVPIYNIEAYVEKCIESLINQTYKDIEILLVDDGSKDSSADICKRFEREDSRVKYLRKENGGLSSARNYGLKHATGDYVFFVDGDDFLENTAIEVMKTELDKNDYDILCFNYYEKRENDLIKRSSKNAIVTNNDVEKYIISSPSACFKIFKLSLFKDNNISFKEGIIYEDLAVIPSLVCYTNKIGFIDESLYYYVIRENSIMNVKQFKQNRDDKFVALDSLEKEFEKNNKLDKYRNEIGYLYIKHLLIMYSTEILIYSRNIYAPRLKKAIKCISEKYPDWEKNIYFLKESMLKRIYLRLIKYRLYFFAVIANKIFQKRRNT